MKTLTHTLMAALMLLTLAFSHPLHAAEVAGVKVEEKTVLQGKELLLNGAGLRTKVFFKVYVAALYLPQKTGNAATVLEGSEPVRMNLRLMRDLDADTLYGALNDGLQPNLQAGELAGLQPFLDQLSILMKKLVSIRSGDTVTLDFTAEGLVVSLNGELRGTVAGSRQARRLLSIWLGSRPVEESLKKSLLGL
jgi:long-chain acyl-CoA synthetase